MPTISYVPDDQDVKTDKKSTILQISLKAGIPHICVCGGNTRCTTCRVAIVEGLENCTPRNAKEQAIADRLHFGPSVRLACQTRITGDVKLRRLVLDKDDIALTSQQNVERVRAEVLAMRSSEDMVKIAGVLWEGLHDVGLNVDYCSIDIIDEEKKIYDIYGVASSWLEKQSGRAPLRRNIVPRVHCYYTQLSVEDISKTRQTRQIGSDLSTEKEHTKYVGFMRRCWQGAIKEDARIPKSWLIVPFSHGTLNTFGLKLSVLSVPFSHGTLNTLSFRPNRFSSTDVQVVQSFADAVSLAYARFMDFQRLQERNDKLQQAYKELQQTQAALAQAEKMASLGHLTAGVAHEINTPLGVLKSNIDIFIRIFAKLRGNLAELKISSEVLEHPKLIKIFANVDNLKAVSLSCIERMEVIISSLRRFSWLDRAELETVNIHIGIEDTLTLVQHKIKNRISVHKDYGDIPKISCYPGQLNQVFMNMLVNASQAIEGKGKIFIQTLSRDNSVVVEFRDTGKGIAKENLDKLFDPGFTTKGVGVGTGLGLPIVYKIIQNHHGKIEVESKVGEGSTFRIVLPIRFG